MSDKFLLKGDNLKAYRKERERLGLIGSVPRRRDTGIFTTEELVGVPETLAELANNKPSPEVRQPISVGISTVER